MTGQSADLVSEAQQIVGRYRLRLGDPQFRMQLQGCFCSGRQLAVLHAARQLLDLLAQLRNLEID